MRQIVNYELVAFETPHYFSIKGKEFVYVNLVVADPQGNTIEWNHKVYPYHQWQYILTYLKIPVSENVPQNIMVGDFYK